jgi:hypothetical protein
MHWVDELKERREVTDRIKTLHPEGKQGVNIERQKYDAIRGAIVEALREEGEIAFRDLAQEVEQRLEGGFDGSVGWYVTTIKLDLEARDIVERVPDKSPQHLRLVASSS